jgi:hypothetical protein
MDLCSFILWVSVWADLFIRLLESLCLYGRPFLWFRPISKHHHNRFKADMLLFQSILILFGLYNGESWSTLETNTVLLGLDYSEWAFMYSVKHCLDVFGIISYTSFNRHVQTRTQMELNLLHSKYSYFNSTSPRRFRDAAQFTAGNVFQFTCHDF